MSNVDNEPVRENLLTIVEGLKVMRMVKGGGRGRVLVSIVHTTGKGRGHEVDLTTYTDGAATALAIGILEEALPHLAGEGIDVVRTLGAALRRAGVEADVCDVLESYRSVR